MDSVKVFCIIVTYNGAKWIRKCISCLLESKGAPVSIVVVDNGSSDETLSILRSGFPEVHVVENEVNEGFGKANNKGIEYAYREGATHFLLLNQDAYIQPGAIERLVDVQSRAALQLVSPVHMNGTGEMMDAGFYRNLSKTDSGISFLGDLVNGRQKEYYEVPFVNAACWLLPRKTIETIGGFDPIFFHYGEDNDYCRRLIWHGGMPAIVPGAIVYHDRRQKGNMALWERSRLLIDLLQMYGICPRSRRERFKFHTQKLKILIADIFLFHFKDAKDIIRGYKDFFARASSIKEHVRINKQVGHSWLSL